MLTTRAILYAMVAPAVIALVITALSAVPRWKKREAHPWGAALAIALALLLSFIGINGRQSFPPKLAEEWLIYLVFAGVPVGLAATWIRMRGWRALEGLVSVGVLVLMVWLVMRPRIAAMEPREFWTQASIIAAGFVVWWLAMDQLSTLAPGPGIPILLTAFVSAEAIVLVNSHTQSLGQIAGGVALALGMIGVIGFFVRGSSLGRGGILALAVAALGLILCGHLYADMTLREMIILCAAPLAMWLGELPGVRKKTWVRFGVRAVAMTIVLSIVLVPAIKGVRETMKEQTESYGY